jgi:hypothetical protein
MTKKSFSKRQTDIQLLIENYERVFAYLSAYGVNSGKTARTVDCQDTTFKRFIK